MSYAVYIVLEESISPGKTKRRFVWLSRSRAIGEELLSDLNLAFKHKLLSNSRLRRHFAIIRRADVDPAADDHFCRCQLEILKQMNRYLEFRDPDMPWTEFFTSPEVPERQPGFGELPVDEFERDFDDFLWARMIGRCYFAEREMAQVLGLAPDGEPLQLLAPVGAAVLAADRLFEPVNTTLTEQFADIFYRALEPISSSESEKINVVTDSYLETNAVEVLVSTDRRSPDYPGWMGSTTSPNQIADTSDQALTPIGYSESGKIGVVTESEPEIGAVDVHASTDRRVPDFPGWQDNTISREATDEDDEEKIPVDSEPDPAPKTIPADVVEVTLCPETCEVRCGAKTITLTPKKFEVVQVLYNAYPNRLTTPFLIIKTTADAPKYVSQMRKKDEILRQLLETPGRKKGRGFLMSKTLIVNSEIT